MMARLIPAHAVVPFADSLRRVHPKEQPFLGIDVVIFEIQTLEPRIVPGEPFGLHERFQEPFLGDPIHASDERLWFVAQRLESETPALEKPIGFFIEAAEMFLGQFAKLPLNVESRR